MSRAVTLGVLVWLVLLFGCAGTGADKPSAPSLPDDVYEEILHHFSSGNYDLVKQYIQRTHDRGIRDKRLYFLTGVMAWQVQDYAQAETAFRQATELDPEYSDAHNNLGTLYLLSGDDAKAEESFRTALKNPLYRTPELAFNNLGKVLEKRGERQGAEQCYRRAISLKQNFPLAYYNLGLLLYQDGRFDDARVCLEKTTTLSPRQVDAWWWYGMASVQLGDHEKAREAFSQVLTMGQGTEWAEQASEQLQRLDDAGLPKAGTLH
ncbi:MAG: tetratricopeptide repeat protein [Deltaproteobacteria bacterium]|nr:tetratricopeptide repeat protein [Candidatus Anaeroferrophillus wilburensis]MBN2889743.1 tetratricopeptide repeat protein [Deltaproteobacteria bacterium]